MHEHPFTAKESTQENDLDTNEVPFSTQIIQAEPKDIAEIDALHIKKIREELDIEDQYINDVVKASNPISNKIPQGTKVSFIDQIKSFFRPERMETNILYRHDRLYRTIGRAGYLEFLQTGVIDSKNKRKYADVSFNLGEPATQYLKKDPSYILEATPDAAAFKPKINFYDPQHKELVDLPYRGCAPGEITNTSPIRIFELTDSPGTYRVVFDNIKDQALIETQS